MSILEEGRTHAIKVLERCAKQTGFYASGLPGGYEATWARDSMIASLGASISDSKLRAPFRKSIELLSKNQSELGQIPNAVGSYNEDRGSDVTYNSIDSTLWYLIGHRAYSRAYQDNALIKKYRSNIAHALLWLRYQDPDEVMLLAQQPTMDWQDAFPHKYGYVLNTQALYYAVLMLYGERRRAARIKRVVNGDIKPYLSLYDKTRGYYLPWAWKNHDGDREQEGWFDTLGNLLAIISGLATPHIARSIIRYINRANVHRPYPCKTMYPPITPRDKEWHSYFSKCSAKDPYQYLNAGIWPFIGGFYVAALVKMKEFAAARRELTRLAHANRQGVRRVWEFNEWLDGKTGNAKGNPYQAWSAGMYLFAYECVKRKQVPFF